MNVKFRKATADDWKKVFPLLIQMGLVRDAEMSRKLFEQFVHYPQHCIVVAEKNQELVSYAWLQNYGAHLRTSDITVRLNDMFISSEYSN
jgi:hypothetical protein